MGTRCGDSINMPWNHRVICHKYPHTEDRWWYGIHEVYYDEKGNLEGYTKDPVGIYAEEYADPELEVGDYKAQMRWTLEKMTEALDKVFLVPEDFPDKGDDSEEHY